MKFKPQGPYIKFGCNTAVLFEYELCPNAFGLHSESEGLTLPKPELFTPCPFAGAVRQSGHPQGRQSSSVGLGPHQRDQRRGPPGPMLTQLSPSATGRQPRCSAESRPPAPPRNIEAAWPLPLLVPDPFLCLQVSRWPGDTLFFLTNSLRQGLIVRRILSYRQRNPGNGTKHRDHTQSSYEIHFP